MESPNKKGPSVWFNELRGLLTLIFQKVSKLVDRVLFDKKGSVIISLVLSIMICVVINYEDISGSKKCNCRSIGRYRSI